MICQIIFHVLICVSNSILFLEIYFIKVPPLPTQLSEVFCENRMHHLGKHVHIIICFNLMVLIKLR